MDEKTSQRTVFRIVRIGKDSYKNLDFDAPTVIASEFNYFNTNFVLVIFFN